MKGPFKFFALFSLALPLALCSCENASSSPSTYVAPTDVVADKYLVTFDTDGGTAVQSQTVKRGETAVRPEDPTKAPYLFCGWYKSNLSEEFDFEAPISSNATVKAIWKFAPPSGWHLVIFDAGGGTAVQPLYIQDGETIGRPTVDPTRSGYSFCGWFNSDLSEEFDFTTPISSNTKIRAKWSGPRKIVFNNNGGEGIMADQTIYPCVRTPLNANAFTLAEHKFVGWADSADSEKIYDDKSEVTIEAGEDPLNLYAVWELKFRESKNSVDTGDIAVRRADGTIRYAPASAWPDAEYPGYSGYESLGVCVKNAASDSPFMINLTQENLTWADAASKYPADGWRVITELQAQDIHNGKEAVNNSLAKIGATQLDMSGGYWVNETTACRFNATNLVTEQCNGAALVRAYMPLKKIGKIAFEKSDVRVASNNDPFTIALSNNGDGIVTYSSSNPSVATVNAATGEVTIVGPGETTIIAKVEDSAAWSYAAKEASCLLHVGEVCIISYAKSTVNKLPIDEPFTNPLSNNAEGRITYSSSNTGVATVDATGKITITGVGTATIIASVAESDAWAYAEKTASYTLNVAKHSGSVSYATTEVKKLFNEDPFTNPITLTGDGEVTYSSSKESVATVDAATGKVTIVEGVLEGETVITATVEDSGTWAYATKKASYTLKVEKMKGILKYSTTKVGKKPDASSFTNALTHVGSGNLSYTSSNESVATVDAATGEVTIKGTGETTITATVTETDGRYAYDNNTASYTLVVKELTFRASKNDVVAGDIAVSGGKYVPAEEWEEWFYSPNGYRANGVCVDSSFMVKAPPSMGTEMIDFDKAYGIVDNNKCQLPTIEQFDKICANLAKINNSLSKISGARVIYKSFHWSSTPVQQESTFPSLKIYLFGNSSGRAYDGRKEKKKGYWYIQVENLK